MEYNVMLEFALPASPEAGDQLVDTFAAFHPAAGPTESGRMHVWLTLLAEDARQAALLGLQLAGMVGARLTALETLPTDEFDRRNGITPMPDLIGAEEAAEILGVTRQAVAQKYAAGELPGRRVGERTLVFARRDVEAAAARRREKGVRRGKFEIMKTRDGLYQFRYKAANGELLMESETFTSKAAVLAAVERVRKTSRDAAVLAS